VDQASDSATFCFLRGQFELPRSWTSGLGEAAPYTGHGPQDALQSNQVFEPHTGQELSQESMQSRYKWPPSHARTYYKILDCTHTRYYRHTRVPHYIRPQYYLALGSMAYHHIRELANMAQIYRALPKQHTASRKQECCGRRATSLSRIEPTKPHNTTKRIVTIRWHGHSKPSCHYSQNTQNATAPAQAPSARQHAYRVYIPHAIALCLPTDIHS
jgi:hypothetical protein